MSKPSRRPRRSGAGTRESLYLQELRLGRYDSSRGFGKGEANLNPGWWGSPNFEDDAVKAIRRRLVLYTVAGSAGIVAFCYQLYVSRMSTQTQANGMLLAAGIGLFFFLCWQVHYYRSEMQASAGRRHLFNTFYPDPLLFVAPSETKFRMAFNLGVGVSPNPGLDANDPMSKVL